MYEQSAMPFWKLLLLFEALICQPETSAMQLNTNVLQHLKLLSAGRLQELFDELSSCLPTKLTNQAHPADIDEWNDYTFGLLDRDMAENLLQRANPGAQKAADRDNLLAAFQHLDHSLPVALNTDATIDAVKEKLYPKSVTSNPYTKSSSRQKASLPQRQLLPKDEDIIAGLQCIRTGTSAGPFADSVDLL